MALKNVTIGNTDTNILDGNQGASVAITVMFVTNTSVLPATLTVFAIDYNDADQSTRDQNTILKDVSISAGDTFTLDTEKLVLGFDPVGGAADKIIAVSDTASALNVTMSYVEL
jgi:hypothetical protein